MPSIHFGAKLPPRGSQVTKMFQVASIKMRELRGAGRVTVSHIPTDVNPADLFTKILSRGPFEKHRRFVMNTASDLDGNPKKIDKT